MQHTARSLMYSSTDPLRNVLKGRVRCCLDASSVRGKMVARCVFWGFEEVVDQLILYYHHFTTNMRKKLEKKFRQKGKF